MDDSLLDFLDSLDDVETFDAEVIALTGCRPIISNLDTKEEKTAEKKLKAKTKSNSWRQRQRLEVLHLRDEVKQLDKELKMMKLAVGVRSTLPAIEGVRSVMATRIKLPALKKVLGESWQDAASRESLARQMAGVENERLHKVLHMQVKHARKLHRIMTQQMTTTVVAQALGCRPAFVGDEACPPKDNNVVFQKLLEELDGHRGNASSIPVIDPIKRDGQVSINRSRGLQVQIVNRYTVPFSVEATELAIWNVLAGRGVSDKHSRVAYNELCFLLRKGCRKYVTDGQTYFV
ncbi:Hypothetical protein PHPALM_1985, partial [Phytophthora palmivora]